MGGASSLGWSSVRVVVSEAESLPVDSKNPGPPRARGATVKVLGIPQALCLCVD